MYSKEQVHDNVSQTKPDNSREKKEVKTEIEKTIVRN